MMIRTWTLSLALLVLIPCMGWAQLSGTVDSDMALVRSALEAHVGDNPQTGLLVEQVIARYGPEFFIQNAVLSPQGQFNLGVIYLDGLGLEQNLESAHFWLTQAANNGHPEAPKALAYLNDLSGGSNKPWFVSLQAQSTEYAVKGLPDPFVSLLVGLGGGRVWILDGLEHTTALQVLQGTAPADFYYRKGSGLVHVKGSDLSLLGMVYTLSGWYIPGLFAGADLEQLTITLSSTQGHQVILIRTAAGELGYRWQFPSYPLAIETRVKLSQYGVSPVLSLNFEF